MVPAEVHAAARAGVGDQAGAEQQAAAAARPHRAVGQDPRRHGGRLGDRRRGADAPELCEVLHRKRARDVRRRVLPMLEDAGIIEVEGDTVRLAADWSERLEAARVAGGELEADELAERRRKMASRAYHRRHETPKSRAERRRPPGRRAQPRAAPGRAGRHSRAQPPRPRRRRSCARRRPSSGIGSGRWEAYGSSSCRTSHTTKA